MVAVAGTGWPVGRSRPGSQSQSTWREDGLLKMKAIVVVEVEVGRMGEKMG